MTTQFENLAAGWGDGALPVGVLQLDELLASPLLAVRLFRLPRMRVTN
jgi:hypothetical protein